jgi:drug/metabolite transporter (DMT)-like permease
VADLSLLLLTLLWGTTFTLVKWALEIGSLTLFLSVRFAVAVAVLGAVALWRRDRIGERFWRDGLVVGGCMYLGFLLQTAGLRFTTPARSGFISGLCVVLVPFIGRFMLGRAVRWSAWAGVALAVLGMAVLTRPFEAGVVTPEVRLGDLLTALSALAFAVQIILMGEWSSRHPLVPFTLLQISVVLVGTLALIPLEGVRFDAGRWPAFAGVVAFTGVAMTAGAFFVMNWAQRHTTPVRAALVFSLEPVAAALFSWAVIGEELGPAGWIGGALIVAGVLAGELGGALEARLEARGRPQMVADVARQAPEIHPTATP